MSRARNHKSGITPPPAFARFCAAWIILAVVSPYALLLPVGRAHDIVGTSCTRPSSPRNDDFEAWAMQDVVLSIDPNAPTTQSVAAMSTSHHVNPEQPAPADRVIVAPGAPEPPVRRSSVTILRV